MTDKEQIIIDGVDVKNCNFFLSSNKYCGLYSTGCRFVPDCYYKQLARKTQELKTICKAFDIEYGYDEGTGVIVGRCNKLIEKENELEEYKQSLNERNKFLQDLGISASGEFKRIKFYIENLKNKYDEKTEECEELISEKDFYLQKIAVLEQECEELKSESFTREELISLQEKDIDHYRKALEEIEEVWEKDKDGDYDFVKRQIFNIINKTKGERNAV